MLQTVDKIRGHDLEERTCIAVCDCRRVRPVDAVRGDNTDAGLVDELAAA
ncbi:MAG: hypothetical protein H7255_18890 [Ramlibacter sp.]|nr:hypothetical protein [Ramlibacter sp.]